MPSPFRQDQPAGIAAALSHKQRTLNVEPSTHDGTPTNEKLPPLEARPEAFEELLLDAQNAPNPFANAGDIAPELTEDIANELAGLTPVEAIQLGIRYQNLGHADRAQAIYQYVLNAQPDNPEALHLLAKLAHQVGDPELALSLLSRAVYTNPTRATYLRTMSRVLSDMGRIEEARLVMNRANELDPLLRPRPAAPRPRVAALPVGPDADFSIVVVILVVLLVIAAVVAVIMMY